MFTILEVIAATTEISQRKVRRKCSNLEEDEKEVPDMEMEVPI